jgi:hypothetical protein
MPEGPTTREIVARYQVAEEVAALPEGLEEVAALPEGPIFY